MSIKLMTEVWKSPLLAPEKLLLLALADYANDEGNCYPGQQSLAKKCSVSDRQIRRTTQKLIELGYLKIVIRGGDGSGRMSNYYEINPLGTFEYMPKNEATGHVGQATGHVVPNGGQPDIDVLTTDKQPDIDVRKGNRTCRAGNRTSKAGATGHVGQATGHVVPTNHQKEPPIRTVSNNHHGHSFDEFYQIYPRKKKRDEAEKAWNKLSPKEQADAFTGLQTFEFSDTPRFQPYPASWLNGKRWKDEPDADPSQGAIDEFVNNRTINGDSNARK